MAIAKTEDEESFKRMWMEAQIRFEEKTGQGLLRSNNQSLDLVLIELDKHFNAHDSDKGSKKQQIKESASNVLKFIELLAGIAAQGASAVFGPATLCFNAMQALISIPAKISKFHDDLALLFEEISAFMKQFKIYRRIEQFAEVDVELKQCTHKVMIVFVDICAVSIDILSGSRLKKIKTLTKIALFDNDSGVRDKLEELKRLVVHQGQISDAVTLEHVLRSEQELTSSIKTVLEMLKQASEASGRLLEAKSQEILDEIADTRLALRTVDARTEALQKDANDRKGERKQQELLSQACKKLSLDHESVQKLEKDFNQMRGDSLQGTGDWLKDIDAYKSWVDLESEVDSPLLLSGSNGSGKSHLAVAALDDLERRYSVSSGSSLRVSVGYYQFTSDKKLSRNGAVKEALKIMTAQIAEKNLVFLKNLCLRLESKDPSFIKNTHVEHLATELIPPPNEKDTAGVAYVLFFDGLDQLSDEAADQLFLAILSMKSSKIRIMLTGAEDESPLYLNPSERGLNLVANIRVENHNEADIKRFIDSEMEGCDVLRGNAPGITRIVNNIRGELSEIVNGNFNNVRQMLDIIEEAVKSALPEEDIMDLISVDTLKNKHSATERLVKKLQESLNVQEIEQLNEILVWTIYAYEYISVDAMRAALFLRTKRTPLQSLEDKVAQKYSRLLQINSDNNNAFEMRNSYLEDYFVNSKRQEHIVDAEGNRDPKILMTVTIDGVKLSKVQRFLWDLSEKVVLDKFTFTDSLIDSEHNTPISANRTEGYLTIIRRCHEVLINEPNEETKLVARYALVNFPNHFWALRNEMTKGRLKDAEREEVVKYLVRLLQSAEYIEKHLTVEFFQKPCWLNDDDLSIIGRWLRDSDAWGKLKRKEAIWVKQAISDEEFLVPALKDVAVMIARHWLCHRTWSAELPFQWLDVFLDRWASGIGQNPTVDATHSGSDNKDSDGKTAAMASEEGLPQRAIPVPTRVIRAAVWAENEVKSPKDSLWYERLGHTYLYHAETGLSIQAFLSAKELPGCSWRVSEGLANAYAMNMNPVLALQEMDVVLTQLRGKQETERDNLVKNLIKAATWQLGDTSDAINKLQEAMRLDEYEYQSHDQLLKIYIQTEQQSKALEFLSEMSTRTARDGSITQLEAMLLEFSKWNNSLEYFEKVFHTARNHDIFQTVLNIIERAITSARERKASHVLTDLLLCHGVALAGYSSEEKRHESALARWTEAYTLGFESGLSYSARSSAGYAFIYYFSEAQSKQATAQEIENVVDKVEALAESTSIPDIAFGLRLLLASLYRLLGKHDATQKLLLNDLKTGLDLLSDNDPENDYMGYATIAKILMHTGDDLNALSAWSLYGPTERRKEYITEQTQDGKEVDPQSKGPPLGEIGMQDISRICNGRCRGENLTWGDSVWMCKVCDEVDFNDECLEKLRKGTLTPFVCSPDHGWLHVPSWADEYRATGKGRVRIGGDLIDGKRVGGQIVPVGEWLDVIRAKWGIEKPASNVQTDNDKLKR